MSSIDINHLTFQYEQQPPTITDVSITIPTGELSLLVGPSGCGKSTLLKIIANLYPSFGGTVVSGSVKLPPQKRLSLMFQDPSQQFTLDTVRHEIIFTLENLQTDPAAMDEIINSALSFAGVTQLADRQFATLSGGEQQKCALAVMVAMDSDIFLFDEPFASIDPDSRQHLLKRLAQLRDQYHKTIIITDHDLSGYSGLVNEIFQFNSGQRLVQQLSATERDTLLLAHARVEHVPVNVPVQGQPVAFHLANLVLTRQAKPLASIANFNLYQDKITLISGHNGIGKSTLFAALAKLFSYQGVITFQGQNINQIRPRHYHKKVALVFQDSAHQFINITVEEELNLSKQHRLTNYFTDQQIDAALTTLGLSGYRERVVYSLSEGQQKKLQILLMLIISPQVLLLDEPLRGLDHSSIDAVFALLNESCHQQHQTIIIISHQLTGLAGLIDYHVKFEHQALRYLEVL